MATLEWDYDEVEEFWFTGEPKNGCGVTKCKNEKGAVEWWTRVVLKGVVEPFGPFKTAKEARKKAEESWEKRTQSDDPFYEMLI